MSLLHRVNRCSSSDVSWFTNMLMLLHTPPPVLPVILDSSFIFSLITYGELYNYSRTANDDIVEEQNSLAWGGYGAVLADTLLTWPSNFNYIVSNRISLKN